MNSRTLNGLPSGRSFRTSRVAFPLARSAGDLRSRTTCYNRFVGGRLAYGTASWMRWPAGRDSVVQMIDTSVVRVHQHGACIAANREQHMGRSRGGLTSKIHAVVDAVGLPVQLGLSPGEAHDNRLCPELLARLPPQSMLLADRRYDADWMRALVRRQGAWAHFYFAWGCFRDFVSKALPCTTEDALMRR
jgi:hypothetical protein